VVGELEAFKREEPEAFAKIWTRSSGAQEGIYEDFERREKTAGAVAFHHDPGEKRSLKPICRKPQTQPDRDLLSDRRQHRTPEVESQAGVCGGACIEVLLLTDPVDAFWTSAPTDFGGKPLKSLSQGDLDFGADPLDASQLVGREVSRCSLGAGSAEIEVGPGQRLERLAAEIGRRRGPERIDRIGQQQYSIHAPPQTPAWDSTSGVRCCRRSDNRSRLVGFEVFDILLQRALLARGRGETRQRQQFLAPSNPRDSFLEHRTERVPVFANAPALSA